MEKTIHRFKTVFISWNHCDQAVKNQVCDCLGNELGINCIWESNEDCSGNITESCMNAIQAASAVVVLITKHSVRSDWVKQEIEYAMKVHGAQYVVPVMLMKAFPTQMPFSELLKEYSGIVHEDESLPLDEMELEQIKNKTVTAINEHCFHNYCENDYLFHTAISVDCVADDVNEVNTRFDLSSIWIDRTVLKLNEQYADEEQIDSQEELLGEGPALLVGEAGCGKSLMMYSLIQKLMSREEKPLVFYLSLRDLIRQGEESLFSSLFDIFRTHCNGIEYSSAMFRSLLHIYKENVWIFFDGIDEIIADSDRLSLQDKIYTFYAETGCSRDNVFFSSRNLSDAEFVQKGLSLNASKLNCCRIEKMDEQQQKKLSEKLFLYLKNEDADGFFVALEEIGEEIKANPFLFTQLAIIYTGKKELPKSLAEIYEESITQYFERDSKKTDDGMQNGLKKHLAEAAYRKFSADTQDRHLSFSLAYQQACQNDANIQNDANLAEKELNYLKRRSIIRNDSFVYQIFMDFYVSKYVFDRSIAYDVHDGAVLHDEKVMMDLSADMIRSSKWDNIVKLLLSMLENRCREDAFIRCVQVLCINNGYTCLLTAAEDVLQDKRALLRQTVSDDLLEKTLTTRFRYYDELFFYIPVYNLYNHLAVSVKHSENRKALCLFRDLCFIYGAKDRIEEVDGLSDETVMALQELCRSAYPGDTTRRAALCREFYLGLEGTPQQMLKKFSPVYPREFCPVHAANRQNDNEVFLPFKKRSLFQDEEHMVCEDQWGQQAYIGLVILPYDQKAIENSLEQATIRKISGVILLPGEETALLPIRYDKRNLYYYSMPDNILELRAYSFNFMYHVTYVFIPEGVDHISRDAFLVSKNLYLYYETCGVSPFAMLRWEFSHRSRLSKKYSDQMFKENQEYPFCARYIWGIGRLSPSLETVKIRGQSIREVSYKGIIGGNLKNLELPTSVRVIGEFAFYGCRDLTDINLPEGLKKIGHYAFTDCSSLVLTELPNKLQKIAPDAFHGCPEATVRLVESYIGEMQDEDHPANGMNDAPGEDVLEEEIEENEVQKVDSISETLNVAVYEFLSRQKTINRSLRDRFENFESITLTKLPENIQRIEDGVFEGCTRLALEKLPDKLTSIGARAFAGCTNLTLAKLPEGVTFIGDEAFIDCTSLTLTELPSELRNESFLTFYSYYLGISAFAGCINLSLTKLPEELLEVRDGTFSGCEKLSLTKLPDKLHMIGSSAFAHCTNLMLEKLPERVQSIGDSAFVGCTSLALTELPEGITRIGDEAFAGCTNLSLTKLPEKVQWIGHMAFAHCTNLALTELPDALKWIGDEAFKGCTNLAFKKLPEGLESIGSHAFAGCYNVVFTKIPETWINITPYFFENCESLALKKLPESCVCVCKCAFTGCINLALTELPGNLQRIEEYGFAGCTSLAIRQIPHSVRLIDTGAFENCTAITSISIPRETEKIGRNAFAGCSGLLHIEIPSGYDIRMKEIFGDLDESVEVIYV